MNTFSKKLALAAGAVVLFGLGITWNIFSEEDYYPRSGSLQFYLRLSPVIQDLPIISPQETPLYYGSAGDGSKEPQSFVSYRSNEEDIQVLISQTSKYLHDMKFILDTPIKNTDRGIDPDKGKVIYGATFLKGGGSESVSFLIYALDAKGQRIVEVTHFE